MSLSIGQTVKVRNDRGIVRFIGKTEFAPGVWIGVELNDATGKNDGSVNGKRYFNCINNDGMYGVFVRETLVSSIEYAKEHALASGLHETIDKLQARLQSASSDIRLYRQKIVDIEKTLSQERSHSQDLEARLEELLIDKEFSTESNKKLQDSRDDLQAKYEEVKTDLQIIQEELNLNRQIEDEVKIHIAKSGYTEDDVKVMLSRNRSLELAMVSLNKLTEENELNFQHEINNLKMKLRKSEDQNYSKTLEKLKAADATISLLQEQLDSALESEKIIENLNIQNNDLVNEVEKLTKTVEELTELNELNKSLEESQSLVEAELTENIKILSNNIQQDKQLIANLEKSNKLLENRLSELKVESKSAASSNRSLVESKNEIESLKLDLRRSNANELLKTIELKLVEAQLDQMSSLPNIQYKNSQYKEYLELIAKLKILLSYSRIALESLDLISNQRISYSKVSFYNLKFYISQIIVMIKSYITIWENNYEIDSLAEKATIIICETETYLYSMLESLKEGNVDQISLKQALDIIDESKQLLNFDEEITESYKFRNRAFLNFVFGSFSADLNISIQLFNQIIKYSEKFPISMELSSRLERLSKLSMEVELESASILQYVSSAELGVDFQLCTDQLALLSKLNSSMGLFELLSDAFKKIEYERNSIKEEDGLSEIEFVNTLFSSDFLDKLEANLKIQFSSLHFQFSPITEDHVSINDVLQNCEHGIAQPQLQDNNQLEVESLKQDYNQLSAKLIDKDRLIEDLQLNISLLESNMASSYSKNNLFVESIQSELASLTEENNMIKAKYIEILEINFSLEKSIQELLETSQFFENGDLLRKFDSISSEKQNAATLALIEEIMLLRRMTRLNFQNGNSQRHSLEWLAQPLLSDHNRYIEPDSLNFIKVGEYLRDISNEATLLYLDGEKKLKRIQAGTSKYALTNLEEHAAHYYNARNLVLSSSLGK